MLIFSQEAAERRPRRADRGARRACAASSGSGSSRCRSRTALSTSPRSTRRRTAASRRTRAPASGPWDRVAGGEIAIAPELGKRLQRQERLPRARQRRGRARACTSAPTRRRSRPIDAVVNEQWARSSGWRPATRCSSRPRTRPPSRCASRSSGSPATRLGAAPRHRARLGLDPDAVQTAVPSAAVADAVGIVQLQGARRRPDRPRPAWVRVTHRHRGGADPGQGHLQQGDLPAAPRGARARSSSAAWPTRSTPASTPAATTRASSPAPPQLSNHSFGLALDLNVPGNQRGTVGEMDRGVVAIFKSGASPGAATGTTPTRCTSR